MAKITGRQVLALLKVDGAQLSIIITAVVVLVKFWSGYH